MSNDEFKNLKLLYVEDEEIVRELAMSYFKRIFDDIYIASSAEEAYEIFKEVKPKIIISDIKMQKLTGVDLIKKVREVDEECQVILLTAYTDTKYLLDSMGLNLVKYIIKPISHEKIYTALLKCLKNLKEYYPISFKISNTCRYNALNKVLTSEGNIIDLTEGEIKFLDLLCKNYPKKVFYSQLEDEIWTNSVMSSSAIRSLANKLRNKLPPNTLENVSKIGYQLKCLS